MKKELDDALCRDFPLTFRDRRASVRSTCMCWGFDCDEGWEPIIRRASEKIERILGKMVVQNVANENMPRASQVKEKYGTLRFYFDCGTDEIYDILHEAEKKSETTCEECGGVGKLRGKGWYVTLCDSCAEKEKK